MSTRYGKWTASGFQRDRLWGKEEVVVIEEPGAWTWEITLDHERTKIIDIRMYGHGDGIDSKVLAWVPMHDLLNMSQKFLAHAQTFWDDGLPADLALEMAELTPGQTTRARPTDEELASAWRSIGPREADGTPRRQALATRYGVSPKTIDLWVSQVRKRSPRLIPAPTTGRGNRKRSTT